MKIIDPQELKGKEIKQDDLKNVTMKALITKESGAPNFALRQFELGKEGYTPYHKHPWEHEVYILEGAGELLSEEGVKPLYAGNAIFIPGEEYHQFRNKGEDIFRFLCIVPHEGHS